MRVISGEAKGRKLKSPKTTRTRPIIDRVKTALFDILSVRVEDTRFLDLFAGTGSVGIEALSRGAASATFIELNIGVLKLVRENLQITGLADRAETIHTDAFKFLQVQSDAPVPVGAGVVRMRSGDPWVAPGEADEQARPGRATARIRRATQGSPPHSTSTPAPTDSGAKPYDIIYVAPPQYQGLAARALGLLDNSPLVTDTGLVIVQIHPKERSVVAEVPLKRLTLTDERRYGSTLLMFYEVKNNKEKSADVNTTTEA